MMNQIKRKMQRDTGATQSETEDFSLKNHDNSLHTAIVLRTISPQVSYSKDARMQLSQEPLSFLSAFFL
jgi:hypothetical protein